MKVNVLKAANGKLWPACDVSEGKIAKLKDGEEYVIDIKTSQNAKLHRKIFGFFAFCTQYYYGDTDAHKDKYQLEFVRKKLTVIAGYYKQVFTRDGKNFELIALSLSYDEMKPEDRAIFYKKIIDAALKRVFDKTTDEAVINKLITWF